MGVLEFNGVCYVDGHASDPGELGWMRGAPVPADKHITFDRCLDFPQIRWSLSHMRELAASVNVWRGRGGPSPLERSDRAADIEALTFADLNGRTHRFDDALYDTYTDGIVVLHRGRIVYERYFGALEPQLPHACFSVTKSYAGTLAAAFVREGVLDDKKAIRHYLPELRGTAWEDATLRQVMDMQTGLAHSEDYVDENSGVNAYARACGWQRPVGYDGPQTMCDYLRTVRKEGAHGEAFAYKTVNTEVMAWVMARVTGRSFAQLLHERLWAALGCEEDAYVRVDPAGMPTAGSSLTATLRDVARFGELMRREGEWNGKQLIPASVVHDVQKCDNRAQFGKGAPWPGSSYRSMWWVTHDEFDAFEARGIHGQRLYVAPKAEMVVARLASHPLAGANSIEPITGTQLLALGRMLRT
ncbi:serine hydrolase [Bradyrhizobium sp. 151]|uniref:serine hydrolase domain-containing protein n=1 Tax=Bradyrhizobium sp. 151 TaxID=2782626 RepID=UPI001FFBF17F|nr:serine hydrolase [Bradyrhizobium sp. 151]MCK1661256.1 serine hydrolase [Bradyrhizobium sp. 151]